MLNYLKQTYYSYKADKRVKADFMRQESLNTSSIHHYNWWPDDKSTWMSDLLAPVISDKTTKTLSLFSVFGDRRIIEYVQTNVIIFLTGEDVNKAKYRLYSDHMLNDKTIDLSLGFEYFECDRYLRFPLWLMYAFEPTFDETVIRHRCAQLRNPGIKDKSKFASLIASHDDECRIRSEIFDVLSGVSQVACPGKFHHNDDSLKQMFADNKLNYLKSYMFNICPENANTMGYVTEKLFEAILSGCVPIYWGSYNNPEPGILNPETIIFWNPQGDNTSSLQLIEDLYRYPSHYEEFSHQSRLLPSAEDRILTMMNQLHTKVLDLLK